MISSENPSKAAITQKYLDVDGLSDAVNPLVYEVSQTVNALPFLAYQKIYYDFFSNPQWEKHKAYDYNVDYWSGTGSISLVTDMVQLRYANYPKDYFMGMLPNSQYGSVAVLPSTFSSSYPSNSALVVSDDRRSVSGMENVANSLSVTVSGKESSIRYSFINSDLSAPRYRDWETDRKSTRLNSSHRSLSRMPSSA